MNRRDARWLLTAAIAGLALGGCGSDGGGTSSTSCPATAPVECKVGGSVVGCCEPGFECASDGSGCNPAGTGGSGASGGAAGSAGAGATGGTGATGGGAGTGGLGGTGAVAGSGGVGGTAGTAGSSGTGGAAGSGGTGGTGGATCSDGNFEPNETEGQATPLGTVTDCQDQSANAKLDGVNADVDWYTFQGTDGACLVNPAASIDIQARLCMYADCPGLTLGCTTGTSSSSPNGKQGCCSNTGTVKLSVDCTGSSDDATVWMRVDQNAKSECSSYKLDFTY